MHKKILKRSVKLINEKHLTRTKKMYKAMLAHYCFAYD